jgi:hypothetical protein
MYHLSPCIVALPTKRVQSDAADAQGVTPLSNCTPISIIEQQV